MYLNFEELVLKFREELDLSGKGQWMSFVQKTLFLPIMCVLFYKFLYV